MRATQTGKRSRRRAAARRRNSDDIRAAAKLSEKFHGRPARKVRTIEEQETTREVLADLGRLISLDVKLSDGGTAELTTDGNVRVAASPDGGQIYFVGGNQQVDLAELGLAGRLPKDHLMVGELAKLTYHTSKAFHNFEPTDYYHRMGEEGGQRPAIHYDVLNKALYLTGGTYQVRPEGIIH